MDADQLAAFKGLRDAHAESVLRLGVCCMSAEHYRRAVEALRAADDTLASLAERDPLGAEARAAQSLFTEAMSWPVIPKA